MSTPIEVVVFKGCKICPTSATRRKIGRYLLDKKTTKFRLPLKLLLLRGSRPKSAMSGPQHLAHKVPNFIQIGSLSAELSPNASTPFCLVEYFHDSPEVILRFGRIITECAYNWSYCWFNKPGSSRCLFRDIYATCMPSAIYAVRLLHAGNCV